MTPAELLKAVGREIEIAVKDFNLEMENQGRKPVTVYLQHLPDEKYENEEYYPLVMPAVAKITDNQNGKSEVDISITIGTYGEDEGAWLDLLSVMERVRQRFCTHRILAHKFQLVLPNVWEPEIEQEWYPYWFGYGALKFIVAQPRINIQELEEYNK